MKRLSEKDYEVLEALQQAPGGLRFQELIERTGQSGKSLHFRLYKLRKANYVARNGTNAFTGVFSIAPENVQVAIRKACCPVCRTERRIGGNAQRTILCNNKDCKRASGYGRQFWIVSRMSGETRYINIAA
jgi:hypothetical protein